MSKKPAPLWREAFFEVKNVKKIDGLEIEMMNMCTALWRGAQFGSKNVEDTTCSDHFWTFGCRKSAPCRGAKHISKSKC